MVTFSERFFGRFVVSAIAAGFVLILLAAGAGAFVFMRTQENADLIAHTLEVEGAVADIRTLTERVEVARRGYLIQPDSRFTTTFEENARLLPDAIARAGMLTSDNPEQRPRVEELKRLSAQQVQILRQSIADRDGADPTAVAERFMNDLSPTAIRTIRDITEAMANEEETLLAERSATQRRDLAISYAVLGLAGAILFVVAGGTIYVVRRNTIELAASRNRLRLMNEDLESMVQERTADLQRANDEIQRFAYIVSHDLRSPLVNVMGFTSELDAATRPLSEMMDRAEAEAPGLVSEDARLAVREDLPEAIGFIRSSTQKMDRLINAILRLSREGRRVITPERLDMNQMLRGIVDSLQHRLVEGGTEITLGPLPTVTSDRVAMEQIFSNLVENAVKYLKPGRPGRITVRGKRQGDRVVFEVQDNGRGIDPKDHERVFDLFRRSGMQDQPGEGIGLAHVRALAYRLGGIIGCESTLDHGATFRLSMPVELNA
ncbi:sensor histidine kinase [Mangrovicella endophytica]|uniref:sensor histidine kinase n=1 Tax=Mangrovicella endophytica TaxID=2066697 RepID=UPI001FDF6AC0|nr:sensor histidine kinase [Mangrovicella endophytica]